MDSLFGRITSLKTAIAPSPYCKYGSVRYSFLPRTSSQLTSSIMYAMCVFSSKIAKSVKVGLSDFRLTPFVNYIGLLKGNV